MRSGDRCKRQQKCKKRMPALCAGMGLCPMYAATEMAGPILTRAGIAVWSQLVCTPYFCWTALRRFTFIVTEGTCVFTAVHARSHKNTGNLGVDRRGRRKVSHHADVAVSHFE